MNPSHYTCSFNVPWLVDKFQSKTAAGPGLWFNVDVPMDSFGIKGRRMKYGIVSKEKLLEDLIGWKYLYVAGRLHKPLTIIKYNEDIMTASRLNRTYASKAAMLLLPSRFSEIQLYTTIAGLSYIGDHRMSFGAENLNKIDNIVLPNTKLFRSLYKNTLEEMTPIVGLQKSNHGNEVWFSQDTSYMQGVDSSYLPSHLHKTITNSGSAPIFSHLHSTSSRQAAVRHGISRIVSRASARQTAVNLVCVGFTKGMSYLLEKVKKRIVSAK